MDTKKDIKTYIYSVIGIALMFVIWHLPPFGPLTTYGMQLLGILVGCIWLWSTIGLLWPSALGIVAMMLSEQGGMTVLTTAFSNSNVLLLLFVFPLFGIISETGVFKKLGLRLLASKAICGKPYLFAFILFAVAAVFSSFANGLVMMLILWTIVKEMATSLGIGKDNQYVKSLITGVAYASLMGYVCVPFIGFGLILNGLFSSYTKIVVPQIMYMAFMFGITFACLIVYILILKFVFRLDVEAFKNLKPEMILADKSAVELDKDQKFLTGFMVVLILGLCLPGLLPKTWAVTQILKTLDVCGISLFFVVALCIIKNSEGKPYLDMQKAAHHISWDMIFLFACAIQLSSAISGDGTGVGTLMGMIIGATLGGLNQFWFVVAFAVVTLLLTNVANNWVVLMVMISTLALYAQNATVNVSLAFMLIAFCGNIGLFLPSASMYGAMLHGDEWMKATDVYKYAGVAILVTVAMVCVFTAIGLVIV